jgi:pimeloyl-ACP methyl ester carboxylesterase
LAACARGLKGLAVPESKLRANRVPVLAIIGEKDPLKAGVDEMQERMSNLSVCVIDDTDHMTCFTHPQFVVDLKKFLAAHSRAKPAAAAAGSSANE